MMRGTKEGSSFLHFVTITHMRDCDVLRVRTCNMTLSGVPPILVVKLLEMESL
jgi:hypothetical protein